MYRLSLDFAGSNFHVPIWSISAKLAPVAKKQITRTRPKVLFLMRMMTTGILLAVNTFSYGKYRADFLHHWDSLGYEQELSCKSPVIVFRTFVSGMVRHWGRAMKNVDQVR